MGGDGRLREVSAVKVNLKLCHPDTIFFQDSKTVPHKPQALAVKALIGRLLGLRLQEKITALLNHATECALNEFT